MTGERCKGYALLLLCVMWDKLLLTVCQSSALVARFEPLSLQESRPCMSNPNPCSFLGRLQMQNI
jgi:hypothetical protein